MFAIIFTGCYVHYSTNFPMPIYCTDVWLREVESFSRLGPKQPILSALLLLARFSHNALVNVKAGGGGKEGG